jgi:hypothetical protein
VPLATIPGVRAVRSDGEGETIAFTISADEAVGMSTPVLSVE